MTSPTEIMDALIDDHVKFKSYTTKRKIDTAIECFESELFTQKWFNDNFLVWEDKIETNHGNKL